jgi:hypothetical protein
VVEPGVLTRIVRADAAAAVAGDTGAPPRDSPPASSGLARSSTVGKLAPPARGAPGCGYGGGGGRAALASDGNASGVPTAWCIWNGPLCMAPSTACASSIMAAAVG